MGQRIFTFDDLDESSPAQTVRFAFDGRQMEIDLTEEHLAEFRELMAPYLEHGRDVEVAPPPPAARRARQARTAAQGRQDLPAVRKWAQERGMTVAGRGRIAREILDAYDQEQAGRGEPTRPSDTG